jgi:hypothetical protein
MLATGRTAAIVDSCKGDRRATTRLRCHSAQREDPRGSQQRRVLKTEHGRRSNTQLTRSRKPAAVGDGEQSHQDGDAADAMLRS